MLLPLYYNHHPSFSPQTLNPSSSSPFPSPSPKTLPFQKPKPSKRHLYISSATNSETLTLTKTAIKRITEKLRTLGYLEESKQTENPKTGHGSAGEIFLPPSRVLPKHRVGHTIDTSWSTPEGPIPNPGTGVAFRRFHELRREVKKQKKASAGKEKRAVAPTLAEMTVSAEELRRLRSVGIKLDKKLKVGKAGITEGVVNGIHERWRRSELVKIKCEDLCRLNMSRTHEILERKTGGLVVWRSGSIIILYRGTNYKYPYFLSDNNTANAILHDKESLGSGVNHKVYGEQEANSLWTVGTNSSAEPISSNILACPSLVYGVGFPKKVRFQLPGEAQLEEEADCLLDGLGPRFIDWWGYDPLPVDADLLPGIVPGYRKPFRLLPYGVKPKLTDQEMTTLRRLSRPLPCHFALGRNRNLQGLATSMVKLWEKCEIAKIAIKRGVQNTNSEIMAEEIKWLTGGSLLSRDREFIVFYRGKDFLPPAVSTAIEERRKYTISRERPRLDQSSSVDSMSKLEVAAEEPALLDELQEANDQKRDLSDKERKLTSMNSAVKSMNVKLASRLDQSSSLDSMSKLEVGAEEPALLDELQEANDQKRDLSNKERKLTSMNSAVKSMNVKLALTLEKKAKAEELLAELEKGAELKKPEIDKEAISKEERYMLRKVGLRMKPFLLLGRRGVFDGTIENMHLHWKYRELVKIISKDRSIEDVHSAARTLEAESGGILVAVERVSKGHAIIIYRGKNYERPADIRPQTLLNKREAMKRSLEAQRRESLKLHVLNLTRNIDQLKLKLVKEDTKTNSMQSTECKRSNTNSETSGHSGPVEFAYHQEDAEAKEGYEADASSLHSIESLDALSDNEETSGSSFGMDSTFHVDYMNEKLVDIFSGDEDELVETEFESSSEADLTKTHSNMFWDGIRYIPGDEDEFVETELESSSEADLTKTHSNMFSDGIRYIPGDEDEFVETELESSSEPDLTKTYSNTLPDEIGYIPGCLGASSDGKETTSTSFDVMGSTFHLDDMKDKLDSFSKDEDEFLETALESSSEPDLPKTCSNIFPCEMGYRFDLESPSRPKDMLQQGGVSFSDTDDGAYVSDEELSESPCETARNKFDSSFHKDDIGEGSDVEIPFRAAPLSNRDRLVLRKQALRMKKRPVLAIGRSNVITGVAKAIKNHFRKNPLAIVNVKGRAKGTSVQEVVFKLEQETGAMLVSREPNKVILYRGWEKGEEPNGAKEEKKDRIKSPTSGGEEVISPKLIAAVRLECGLQSSQEEDTS